MSNYRIRGNDIENVLEIFKTSEGVSLTHSSFDDSRMKKTGSQLDGYLDGYIPTSAGSSYLGGSNLVNYKTAGNKVDCALRGYRPSGALLLATVNGVVGSSNVVKYVNRIDGQTWFSDSPNSATGTRLNHDPKCLHIFLTGGGGSGSTIPSTSYERRGGGSAGASVYYPAQIPENGYLEITVGYGGQAKSVKSEPPGNGGGASYLRSSAQGLLATANGGYGGGDESHCIDGDHGKGCYGGTYAIGVQTSFAAGNAGGFNGGYGGGAETDQGTREAIAQTNVALCVPEGASKTVGGFPATSPVNNAGGFGGNSIWAAGGVCAARSPGGAGSLGSGGASCGRYSETAGNGGPGVCYIYY